MDTRLVAPLIAVAALCTACTSAGPGAEFTEILPDDRIYVNVPVDSGAAKDAEDGIWSDYYLLTARVTDDVNAMIALPLILIDLITDTPPSDIDDERTHAVWGPYSDALDPVETALHVEHYADDSWEWYFVQKPANADDAEYTDVIRGTVDAGSTREVHSGQFAIAFDVMQELDPNVALSGVFVSEYDVNATDVTATALFSEVAEHDGEPIDALYAYEQVHDGEGAMDLGWLADIDDDGDDESHIVRSRWTAEGAGRSDAYLTGGTLGDLVFNESECWDEHFDPVYNSNNWSEEETGDVADCAFAEAEWNDSSE